MVYKFSNLIQSYTYNDMTDFLLDVEDTFKQKIDYEKTHDFARIMIIATKFFIEDVFYKIIFSPHETPEMQTRFSMFEDYTVKELAEMFQDDKIKNLAFTISEDRLCFVEEVDNFPNLFSVDDGKDIYYIYNDSISDWINKANNNNHIMCFDFK